MQKSLCALVYFCCSVAVCFGQTTEATQPTSQQAELPPAPLHPANEPPRVAGVPTLWLVGDSTVHVGTRGQLGWGDPFAKMFDPAKIRVLNRAIGGRSSRTFITEGRWDDILAGAQAGDFVIIQIGHNDGGPLAGDNRERGSIRGTGDETKDVILTLGRNKGMAYTVHTYGWYLSKMVTDAQAKGMTPIVCSWIPHCPKPNEKYKADPEPAGYRKWAEEVAKKTGAHYIDLYGLVWKTYAGKTPEELRALYFTSADFTHTSPDGALNNATCVAEGIKSRADLPLAGFLKPVAATQP